MSLLIPVIVGTPREERTSDKAAHYVAQHLAARGVEVPFVDPREELTGDTAHPFQSASWAALMAKADGLVIVTPEYNHGYPGSLKNLLDGPYKEYHRKPVAICGCSMGPYGGVRVVEQLRQVVIELHMTPIREAVYFSKHLELWNMDGTIKDDSYGPRVDTMIDELLWYAEVLKVGRDTRPFPGAKKG